jgi:hypothetical protein
MFDLTKTRGNVKSDTYTLDILLTTRNPDYLYQLLFPTISVSVSQNTLEEAQGSPPVAGMVPAHTCPPIEEVSANLQPRKPRVIPSAAQHRF